MARINILASALTPTTASKHSAMLMATQADPDAIARIETETGFQHSLEKTEMAAQKRSLSASEFQDETPFVKVGER